MSTPSRAGSLAMAPTTQALVLTLVGATLVRLTLTDAYLRYVNAWMRWPLLVSGVLLVALALARVLRPAPEQGDHEDPDDGEGGVSRAAWLLLAPVLVVFTISPPALGAYSAERLADEPPPARAAEEAAFPLPPSDGPVEISVVDFVVRVTYDDALSLAGRDVAVVGFVSGDDDGGWYVTRMSMACCAADASASRIRVTGADAPPRDSWVRVTGRWDPLDGGPPQSVMAATDVVGVDAPRNPYG